jgi:hypothetical protein
MREGLLFFKLPKMLQFLFGVLLLSLFKLFPPLGLSVLLIPSEDNIVARGSNEEIVVIEEKQLAHVLAVKIEAVNQSSKCLDLAERLADVGGSFHTQTG